MRRYLPSILMLFVIGVSLLSAPGLACAADEQKSSEPNLLAPRFDLTIWTIVVFVVLLLVLRYIKLPGASAPAFVMMVEGLKKREQNIQGAFNEAHLAREEAQKLKEQLQREMQESQTKVAAMIEAGRKDAQAAADALVAKARDDIQRDRERLRREIDVARDQALQELWNQTAQLATLVSAKAIRRQLTPDDHRRLVDEALAELRTSDGQRQKMSV